MAFGERLQELRRARGMTQEDFAAQLKVSRQAVSKWESCRGYPELEKIIYICNRYGVTMNDLFCEEVPLGGQETPAAPERMESRTLKTALGDFVSNLSPANKWAGVGGLAAVTALVALCMLYLKGGGDSEMTALWIAAIVVFGVVEAVTAGLVSIWFVPGAVAGLIAAMAGAGLLIQLVLFLAVSAAALAATRPLVKRSPPGGLCLLTRTGCWAAPPESRRPSTTTAPPAPSMWTARPGPPAAPTDRCSRRAAGWRSGGWRV